MSADRANRTPNPNPHRGYAEEGSRARTYIHYRGGEYAGIHHQHELHAMQGPGSRITADCPSGFQAYVVTEDGYDAHTGRVVYADYAPDDIAMALQNGAIGHEHVQLTAASEISVVTRGDGHQVSATQVDDSIQVTVYRSRVDKVTRLRAASDR